MGSIRSSRRQRHRRGRRRAAPMNYSFFSSFLSEHHTEPPTWWAVEGSCYAPLGRHSARCTSRTQNPLLHISTWDDLLSRVSSRAWAGPLRSLRAFAHQNYSFTWAEQVKNSEFENLNTRQSFSTIIFIPCNHLVSVKKNLY